MVSRSRPLVPPLVVSGLQLALLAGCGALPEPIRSPTSCSFVPWELSAVLWDDTGYLQCARCGSARAGSRLADHCRGPARLDEARHGLTRRDQARRRGAWQGGARPGKARQGKAHCFSTRSRAIRWTRCDWLYERGPTCASGRVRRVSSHTLFFLANCQKGHPEVALR
jgi:hypothetical protein